jgi:hypothetical protein
MALNQHITDHLDKRSGGLTYTVSGAVATITSASVPVQRLVELEKICDVTGHELVISGGVLKIQPKP